MSENMGVNRKQLMKKDAVSQGMRISTDLTGNTEICVRLVRNPERNY